MPINLENFIIIGAPSEITKALCFFKSIEKHSSFSSTNSTKNSIGQINYYRYFLFLSMYCLPLSSLTVCSLFRYIRQFDYLNPLSNIIPHSDSESTFQFRSPYFKIHIPHIWNLNSTFEIHIPHLQFKIHNCIYSLTDIEKKESPQTNTFLREYTNMYHKQNKNKETMPVDQ